MINRGFYLFCSIEDRIKKSTHKCICIHTRRRHGLELTTSNQFFFFSFAMSILLLYTHLSNAIQKNVICSLNTKITMGNILIGAHKHTHSRWIESRVFDRFFLLWNWFVETIKSKFHSIYIFGGSKNDPISKWIILLNFWSFELSWKFWNFEILKFWRDFLANRVE